MLWLIATSLLLGDTLVGPYITPFELPPHAIAHFQTYGTLYRDDQNELYVIYPSNPAAKIYLPPTYNATYPTQIRWHKKGLAVFNSLATMAKFQLRAPLQASKKIGTLEWVMYVLPLVDWGQYYWSKGRTQSDPGFQNLGVWPPPANVMQVLNEDYGITSASQLLFETTMTSLTWTEATASTPVLIATIPDNEISTVTIQFSPMLEDLSYYNFLRTDFEWAGMFDLNVDGVKNEEDRFQFQDWMDENDPRADWNEDGVINENDRTSFEAAYEGRSAAGGGGGGCALENDQEGFGLSFVIFVVVILLLRRRKFLLKF